MLDTIARQKLAQKIGNGEITQSSLARDVGKKQPSARAWVLGLSRPETHLRPLFHRLYNIHEDDWLTDDEFEIAHGHKRADCTCASTEEAKEAVAPTGTGE